MQVHLPNNVVFTAREVFSGEEAEELSVIGSDTSDLSRFLLHRLKVLAAALYELERLQCHAANAPIQGTA